jgi:hypothetical protein
MNAPTPIVVGVNQRRAASPIPHRDPPTCADMPQMPTSDRADGWRGRGAQLHAVVYLVLGRLPDRRPNSRHVSSDPG